MTIRQDPRQELGGPAVKGLLPELPIRGVK